MINKLFEVSGEYCGRRTTPGLSELRDLLRKNIKLNQKVIINTDGVKSITPSYIDELLPVLMIEFGKEKVLELVEFSPPLEGYALQQVDRGHRIRLEALGKSE